MIYTEERKSIFKNSTDYALAVCISEDAAFNEGVSIEFAKLLPNTTSYVRQMSLKKGNAYLLSVNEERTQNVFYLVTKSRFYDKPSQVDFRKAVYDMREWAIRQNITKIAMNKLGTPLDGLDWDDCRAFLVDMFKNTNIELLICTA